MKTKPTLSAREKEILELISLGFTTPEIARMLYISFETIKTHRCNLIKKLNAKNTAHLIRIAGELNLLLKKEQRRMKVVNSNIIDRTTLKCTCNQRSKYTIDKKSTFLTYQAKI